MRAGQTVTISACAVLAMSVLRSQSTENPVEPPVIANPSVSPPSAELNKERILGVIPNYQTVNDPNALFRPLTVRQKFTLFARETVDPFTFAGAAMGAGLSQSGNEDPKYGQGGRAFAQRFGAAFTDIASQNFFADFLLASVLREDPRYFRRGSEYGFFYRVGYAVSRVVITRTDSGHRTFNFAGIGGMAMGIGLSDAYYPPSSVNAMEFGSRILTSLTAAALGNILPEFWPDIQRKLFHKHDHSAPPTP